MKKHYIQAVLEMIRTGQTPEVIISGLKAVLAQKGHQSLFAPVLLGVLRVLESETERLLPSIVVAKESDIEKHQVAIKTALAAIGTDEEYVVTVDDTIIGGFIASVGNTVHDQSYKTKLVDLYRNIAK